MRLSSVPDRRPQALALVLAWGLLLAGLGPADTREEVATLFASGAYGEAYARCEGIEDAALRAEWRFHLLYTGGDLPGALGAARSGLEAVPGHRGLLANAARCATLLGLGREALEWSELLARQEGPAGETSEEREARRAGGAALVAEARRIAELEAAGESARGRAFLVACGGLVLAAGALVLLAVRR